jgi:hypothetical protein
MKRLSAMSNSAIKKRKPGGGGGLNNEYTCK